MIETVRRTKPTETGIGYSVTDVILSDNAQEALISGLTRDKLTPKALDTNITTEYHKNCTRLTEDSILYSCCELTALAINQLDSRIPGALSSLAALSLPFLALDDGIFDPKLNRSARSRFNPRRKC